MRFNYSFLAILVGSVTAVVPPNMTICDYYTSLLFGANNATTQWLHMTMLVNTALVGNYTMPNVGVAVNGILNPGNFQGTYSLTSMVVFSRQTEEARTDLASISWTMEAQFR
jgi:hypothetical protein